MAKIGFLSGMTQDDGRSNWAGDAARPLAWSAWYPADNDATAEAEVITSRSLYIPGRAIEAAPLSDRRKIYPLVFLSHGTGGTAAGLSWLAERLADNGFIVVGANHHGNTDSEPYRAEGFLCWWERAADLTALLDYHATAGPFAGCIDPDRVTVAGFSLGGHTALALLGGVTHMPLYIDWAGDKPFANGPREFPDIVGLIPSLIQANPVFRASWERQSTSCLDSRFKAAFLCAPAPTVRGMTAESLSAIANPVSIVAVGQDMEAPTEECAIWLHHILHDSRFELLDPLAGHYVFLNECTDWGRCNMPTICLDPPGISRRSVHERAAALALEIFGSPDDG